MLTAAFKIAALATCLPFIFAGSIVPQNVKSTALEADLPINVYVPEGEAPPEGWPVLYLLHGHAGSENSWVNLGDIENTLDRMIAVEQIQPLLVVMPGAKNSWYVNSKSVAGPGDYETALTVDLREYIEATYPVRTDRKGRAIAGLSMGGFGALRLAYARPDLYVATASLSGAIWQNIPKPELDKTPDDLKLIQDGLYFHRLDGQTVVGGVVVPSTGDHFSGSFGTPFDARHFNQQNIFTLAAQNIADGKELPATYLTVGDDDGFHLWRGAVALHATLASANKNSELRITDGDHVWSLWKQSIVDALLFIETVWKVPETE